MADGKGMRRLCGGLVVGGFEGTTLPLSFERALAAGERGGAILFSRNLTQEPMQCAELARALAHAAPRDQPPLIGIDQEGGRVARLKGPVLQLPAMRTLADWDDEPLLVRSARALGRQLASLGFTMNFAPVLDVNTLATNPIIGDRAFSSEPSRVSRLGTAWARALEEGGVLSCGKHFPGHGDTNVDSHVGLPVDRRERATLEALALAPFEAAARAGMPAWMTAHVMYPALDRDWPATLSPGVLAIARTALAFRGCLISDDLEMKAVADRWPIEESAVRAVAAGCDVLLICRSEELQERAVTALAARAAVDAAFEARCREAQGRFLAMKLRVPPRPVSSLGAFEDASELAREVEATLAQRRAGVAS